jgi:hypothetical protein
MPQVRLDATDAAELAEMLQFLSQWLGRDPAPSAIPGSKEPGALPTTQTPANIACPGQLASLPRGQPGLQLPALKLDDRLPNPVEITAGQPLHVQLVPA